MEERLSITHQTEQSLWVCANTNADSARLLVQLFQRKGCFQRFELFSARAQNRKRSAWTRSR